MSPSSPQARHAEQAALQLTLVADQRPGHRRQLESLALALDQLRPVQARWVEPLGWLKRLTSGKVADTHRTTRLVLACGRRTLRTALWLAGQLRCPAVALMNPRHLRPRFDLSVVPRHDGLAESGQVLVTDGVLSPMRPGAERIGDQGLILIGGPASHYRWDNASIWQQIRDLTERHPIQWTLTTSRRTPASFLSSAPDLVAARLKMVDGTRTAADWLPQALGSSQFAWVSEDSAAMVYDALSAGAATGILQVTRVQPGRVASGVDELLERGLVRSHAQWLAGENLVPPRPPLAEAERVAQAIAARGWLQ